MRRANLARLPVLMHWYPGLKPWDLRYLSPLEIDALWSWVVEQSTSEG